MYRYNLTLDLNSIVFVLRASYYDYTNKTYIVKKSEEPDNQKLFLLSKICNKDFFENMPKTFTISTKNSTLHFNIDLLKETSPVITKFIQDNPNSNNFTINLTDDENVLTKFEQLYQGKSIFFKEEDLSLLQRFTQILQIKNCPNCLKPKSLYTNEIDSDGKKIYSSVSILDKNFFASSVEIYKNGFISFLNRDEFKTFTITTKKKEYQCCIFGVYTSNVIRQILENDTTQKKFDYDFEDTDDEFQLICDFFNCKTVDITNENMDSLKEIAEDLQINCILQSIDNYINNYEKVTQRIDEQEEIIDKIDQLFDLLCNVKKYGVDKVKQQIVLSKWSKKERQVEELGAFIVQVIKGSFSLQREIAELVVGLNEESDDGNELKILLPFIVERLVTLYWPHPLPKEEVNDKNITRFSINAPMNDRINSETEEIINLTNKCVYSFIRLLYKRGAISKDDLYDKLKRYDLSNNALNAFFLPELIDIDPKKISEIESLAKTLKRSYVSGIKRHRIISLNFRSDRDTIKGHYYFWPRFAKNYLPDKIEMYEKMLDEMEPDDEMTKTIWKDDVDSLQRILSRDCKDMKTSVIPYNIFDDFEEEINLLNYSAFYGSIKCFKFLLLNQCEIDDNTFYYAVCGGNNEIIKIVDQQKIKADSHTEKSDEFKKVQYQNIATEKSFISFWFNYDFAFNDRFSSSFFYSSFENHVYDKYSDNLIQYHKFMNDNDIHFFVNCCNINNIIAPTIVMNKNNLFDWIFENKFVNDNKSGNDLKYIAFLSASCGNAHSLIALIDNGFYITKRIISNAARNGFYELTKFLLDLYDKKATSDSKSQDSNDSFDYKSIVHFGNLSIFKLFIKNMKQKNLEQALLHAIKMNYTKIVQYVFENLNKFDFKIDNDDFFGLALTYSIQTKHMFNLLFDIFKKLRPELFKMELFTDLLIQACLNSNLQVAEEITELILKENEKYDFTDAFFKASSSKSINICQYLLDKKVLVEFKNMTRMSNLGSIDVELFKIIMNNVDENIRSILYESIHGAISNKNKEVIELILKEQRPIGNELIESIKTDDVEIVDLILKYNSDASFVNQKTMQGPAFNVAVQQRNLEIVKRLLCVPGIDVNLYSNDNKMALGAAVLNEDIEIIDAILDFYEKSDDPNNLARLISVIEIIQEDYCREDKVMTPIDWKIIERFIKIKSIDPNYYLVEAYSVTALPFLSVACYDGQIDIVEALLALENINVNIYDPKSFDTPLMFALNRNNLKIAELLIKYPKTNINMRNINDESALAMAVRKKQKEIIDLLVNDEKFDPFESRLNCAFIYASNEIAEQLSSLSFLDVNQFYFNPTKNIKINALHHSVEINDVDKIDMIIGHPSFDVYKSQVNKALFIAAKRNNINVFQKLIKLIDNNTNIYNDNKVSLISYAAMELSGDIVDAIINDEHFDPKSEQIVESFICSYSNLALETDEQIHGGLFNAGGFIGGLNRFQMNQIIPIWETNQSILNPELLEDKCSIIEMMERLVNYDNEHEHLIKFDKLLPKGKSFFTAICSDYSDIGAVCNFLIEHGVDPNTPDKDGIYPLEHAININSLDMVTSLVNNENIKYPKLRRGSTYLHLAARVDKSSILSFLLQKNKFDINSVDDLGETPLMYACKSLCIENIDLLFKDENIDYLHCNKNGKDALDLFVPLSPDEKKTIKQSKDSFHDTLVSVINAIITPK